MALHRHKRPDPTRARAHSSDRPSLNVPEPLAPRRKANNSRPAVRNNAHITRHVAPSRRNRNNPRVVERLNSRRLNASQVHRRNRRPAAKQARPADRHARPRAPARWRHARHNPGINIAERRALLNRRPARRNKQNVAQAHRAAAGIRNNNNKRAVLLHNLSRPHAAELNPLNARPAPRQPLAPHRHKRPAVPRRRLNAPHNAPSHIRKHTLR